MNNRNPFRKTISVLLALALVLSPAPVRAMAAGQEVSVCGCESDDPSWHAPFCEAYVAPEDPQCLCVEKCAEGAANEWCEVCYFDPAACAASGEEEAAVYATAPTYISKIAVSYGAKESTPKDILSNNGFTIVDYDLNKGCGASSHYIYLGYKLTNDPSQAITGIFARTGNNPPASATFDGVTAYLLGGSGETNPGENMAVDLNVDAGGDYIYFYVTRDPSRAPITEITFDGNSSKSGYVTPNVDLNKGTKGSGIYLHYKQFSATVSATYHYLTSSGSRTSSTQSGTVKTHLEQMSKVPSYPTSVTYEGRTYTFKGWREDNTANTASTTAPYATYMTGTKTYRAVYQGNVTVSFNANGGSGAPAAVKGSHYINAGSSSVSKQSVSVTIPSGSCTHPTKCNFLGWAAGQSATSAAYQPGGSITVSGNTTLYAVYADHSYNDKGICTACSGLDHTCQYSANGFCTRCDGYQPAVLKDGYYQIGNGGQMFWFANHINTVDRTASAKLTADIDLENRAWSRIGSTGEGNNNFRGHFDGQGHTVEGLKVTAKNAGGGFFGEVRLGTVENFTIKGTVTVAASNVAYVGGVIGSAPGANSNQPDHNGATIRNIISYVNVTVQDGLTGVGRIGGFIGYANHETIIENCAWYGTIDLGNQTMDHGAGGFIGRVNENSAVTIRNCGAYGSIVNDSVTTNVGAFMGFAAKDSNTVIENCLFAGSVSGDKTSSVTPFGTWNGASKTLRNSYYINTLQTTDADAVKVTADQLASGEVAYKLGAAWGQTIGSNAYPILGGQKVYCGYADCQATVKTYANAPLAENVGVHSYDKKGFCTMCGGCQPATGDGTQDNPYKIGNAGQLYWFAAVVNAGYGGVAQNVAAWAELTANITVNADVLKEDGTLNGDGSGFLPWTPIGSSSSRYTGTFNGNGKTVSGLYFNGNTSNVGLIGYLKGTVKNVGVVDSCLSGSASFVGGVVGRNDKGTITDCYNEGTVSGYRHIGGVVGYNSGTVEDCYKTGTVSGSYQYVGGVVGSNSDSGTVVNSYSSGSVSGSKDYVGGVVGDNKGTVEYCYNTGTVSGSDRYVGGVVGINSGTVEYCYNTGTVSGTNDSVGGVVGINSGTVVNSYSSGSVSGSVSGSDYYVGGVVGQNDAGTITGCYNEGTVSGYRYVGGVVGHNRYGTVESCYNSGSVSGSDYYVGGVVGYNNSSCIVANCYNAGTVSSSDYAVGGVAGLNEGTVVNCYYNSTVCSKSAIGENTGAATDVWGKPTAEFASGAVTYSLSQGCTVGEGEAAVTYPGDVWGQNIDGEGEKDAYPVFSDAKVYAAKNCANEIAGYSNTDGKQLDHTYENGFCTVCDGFQSATGSGTESDPYKIGNAGQLYWFAAEVNDGDTDVWAELTANIVVNENVLKADGTLNGDGSNFYPWTPIGTVPDWYTGTFDGNDKTVSGLYVNENTSFVGLFGWSEGTVKNVGVVDSYISGSEYAGGVVGKNVGTVEESYNTGNVSGGAYIGGVVGKNDGTVEESYNTGSICGSDDVISVNIGGVVGFNSGSVEDCYNTGAVSGIDRVGGVVGSSEDPVANCYNTGNVSGNSAFVGGVAGSNYGPVVNCYYDSTVYSGNAIGFAYPTSTNNVEGKTTEQFKSGEVAYLLQGEQTQQVWGQNIDGEGEKDAYPVFSDAKVYPAKNCDGSDGIYSNTQDVQKDHIYSENGFCTFCKGYQPATGDGTESDPYKIGNAGQLYWFAAVVNDGYGGVAKDLSACAELTADITVNENVLTEDGTLNDDVSVFFSWTPIGETSDDKYFGTFDGKEYTVSGLYFNENINYVGLFGYVGMDGTVKNVGVVDSYLSGYEAVGGVVGQNDKGTITGCYNEGTVSGSGNNVGGVVGTSGYNSTVENCYNTGRVSGSNFVGGVVGSNYGTVESCHNTGIVSGDDGYVSGSGNNIGGVVGANLSGTIRGCYNEGSVSGSGNNVGGVAGYIMGSVKNCYNTGNVSGKEYVGGVVGQNNGAVLNSYNSGDVSGKEYVGGVVGQNNSGVLNSYNSGSVGGSGSYIGGVVGENSAGLSVMNCYYDSTVYNGNAIGSGEETATNVEGKTTEQFKSGEVAFLLQGEQTQQVWGQNIDGTGDKDAYPVFSDAKVYPAKNCDGSDGAYSNTQDVQKDHIYSENGFCTFCDGYESPTGNGTESDPYKISNAGQLYWFAAVVNTGYGDVKRNNYAYAELTGDITVNENVLNADGTLNSENADFRPWTPIGGKNSIYNGSFDGREHTVSGLYHSDTGADYVGLFGYTGDGAKQGFVQNVGVVDSYLSGGSYVGGVVGTNSSSLVNCYNKGTVIGNVRTVGGVVGLNHDLITNCFNAGLVSGNEYNGGVVGFSYGSITHCYNEGTVSGVQAVGGVVGHCYDDNVIDCYNTGSVSGMYNVGGVVGTNYENNIVTNCYNTGSVSGTWVVGGVIANNIENNIVTNCYSTGTVSGEMFLGGVMANNRGTVVNCYFDSTVCSANAYNSNSGTATDVLGKTTAQFASGEVAYLLSRGCTLGEGETAVTYLGDVWGQNIDGEGEKDAYPVFSDATVYPAKNCKGETSGYSNTDGKQLDHTYENGFCTVCGGFQPATGDGIESDPYKIGNAGQLYWFAAVVNEGYGNVPQNTAAWAELTANITVNTGDVAGCNGTKAEGWKDWIPIGKDYDTRYAGTFDGKEFTVSGLYFNNSDVSYLGLFGFSNGTIKNVGVVNSYLHGFEHVCGVVSENYGTVEGCYNTGTVSGTGDHMIGGVVGNNEGTVESCYNAGSVSGTGTGTRTGIGGVTGYNYGTVEGCYNAGPVSGSSKVGGVVGLNVKGTVVGCYNIGTVSGRYAVGGVVGDNTGGDRRSVVTNCYNTGAVSASGESVGGVAGSNGGDISCCYNTGTVSGSSKVGGVVGYNGAGFTVINSYNNSDAFSGESIGLNDGTAVDVLNKTGAQFASGEVTYLLQGEQTQQIWGQNVDGEGEKDPYPIFSEVTVYPVSCCPGEYGGYSNTEGKQQAPKYNENGFCIYCGGYESASGRGTEADPYQISNAGQLYWFAAVVNTGYGDVVMNDSAWAELTANITVNEAVLKADGSLNDGTFQAWTPIASVEVRYLGTFDGNGFAVSGLYFHDTTAQYAGLFGFLEGDAVVRNVGVVDSSISGGIYVGAVAGVNTGTVEGCYNAGTVIVGESYVGGIVGQNVGFLTNCYNTGAVSGNGAVGGVAGQNGGFLTNCYNAGPVSGSVENIGGVTGFNVGSVTNCYYDSTVYSGEAFGNSYGTATKVEGKSTAEFASGAVTYSLSQGCTVGETTYSGDVWGQNIDGDDKDAYPLFSDAKVYFGYYDCLGSYTNNASVSQVKPEHSGQLTYVDNGDDATHTVTCDTCGDVVDASQIHSYGEDHKCLCGAVEEVLSVTISWGSMVFVYTEEAGWNNPDSAWVKTENTGNLQISVTYTYETDRTDIAGIFSDGTNSAASTAVILPEQTYQVWLRLEGKPDEVLDNAVIGTVKVTVG